MDSDRPTSPPPPEQLVPEERPTLAPCLACGGDYVLRAETPDGRYRMAQCLWCTRGGMDEEQRRTWVTHRRRLSSRRGT